MTKKEHIEKLEAENAELRAQVTSLTVSLAKVLDAQAAIVAVGPQPQHLWKPPPTIVPQPPQFYQPFSWGHSW